MVATFAFVGEITGQHPDRDTQKADSVSYPPPALKQSAESFAQVG